jgi:AmmeMemoRadiSam system protein B
MDAVRKPAVAGRFYPASRDELREMVERLLRGAAAHAAPPKAIIAPHAGYVYSGPVAASVFSLLARSIERAIVVGPAHRVFVDGVVAPGAARMRTPLGDVEVDVELASLAGVHDDPHAHALEHSIEVELPFLQMVAPHAKVLPLAVGGDQGPREVARVLRALWGGPETVIVISSDLSHYLPYDTCREVDRATAARIVSLATPIDGDEACGAGGINGLLEVAREKGLRVELVDLRSSGDTAGPRDEVVGYGGFAFHEEAAA